jgi:hypothetical protein
MAIEANVFDVFARGAITDIVRRQTLTAWEQAPFIGDQIAPLVPVYDSVVKREIAEIAAFGLGQFKAPDASPPLYAPRLTYTEEVTELLHIDEMTEIKESLWRRLTSSDDNIKAAAGVELLTNAKVLQLRNERRTEWMRWQAFKGGPLVITYPDDGQQLSITYNYLAGHKPVSAIAWTDRTNSTPIDDLRAWQQIVGNDTGVYASKLHMNTNTWQNIMRSNQARGYLTPTDRNLFVPKMEDVQALLWGNPDIIVTDTGYRDESANYNRGQGAITKFLPDGYVLMTNDYMFEGEPIADVCDGPVAVSESYNTLALPQGPQSEVIIDHRSKTHYFRQASTRIPRLRRPGAFLYGRGF